MVCISKQDKKLRIFTDFRIINRYVMFDSYSMHCIDDQIIEMAECLYFFTLDITKKYH